MTEDGMGWGVKVTPGRALRKTEPSARQGGGRGGLQGRVDFNGSS